MYEVWIYLEIARSKPSHHSYLTTSNQQNENYYKYKVKVCKKCLNLGLLCQFILHGLHIHVDHRACLSIASCYLLLQVTYLAVQFLVLPLQHQLLRLQFLSHRPFLRILALQFLQLTKEQNYRIIYFEINDVLMNK